MARVLMVSDRVFHRKRRNSVFSGESRRFERGSPKTFLPMLFEPVVFGRNNFFVQRVASWAIGAEFHERLE